MKMKRSVKNKTRKAFCVIIACVMLLFMLAWPIMTHAAEAATATKMGTEVDIGATLAPTTKTTVAATSAPYTDVTIKKVGKKAYNAIKYLKAHGGFKNVFTGKKFYPNEKITRRQFVMVLRSLYGASKVPFTDTDLTRANQPITAKYACGKMVVVAKNLGIPITWNAPKSTLTRAGAANYIKVFIDYDKAFQPKK